MIVITNQTPHSIPRQLIFKTLSHVCGYLKIKKLDLSVVFVSQSTIKKLNSTYRRKNQTTDVLSFSYQHNQNDLDGEIIICYAILKKNAKTYKQTLKQELIKILIHSLLHLTGYTHTQDKDSNQMQKVENKIINSLKI